MHAGDIYSNRDVQGLLTTKEVLFQTQKTEHIKWGGWVVALQETK